MIETFYNNTVTVTRGTTASPTASDTITTVGAYLGVRRPIDEEDKVYVANNVAQAECFITDEDSDIQVGDKLILGSDTWRVQGVSTYVDLEDDTDSYLKAIITTK